MKPFDLATLAKQLGLKVCMSPTAEIEPSRTQRKWRVRIPCLHGHVGIHSATELTAHCRNRIAFLKRFEAIAGVGRIRLGDKEFDAIFGPAALADVCELLRARKRCRATPEAKQRFAEMNAARAAKNVVYDRRLGVRGDRPV